MKRHQLLSLVTLYIICFTSCGSETFTCSCKGTDGKVIATHKIEADKRNSASFECHQKELALSGNPEYEGVKCELE